MPDVMKTLLLNPPSFENFDGGASSRWPATREIESNQGSQPEHEDCFRRAARAHQAR